MRKLALVTLLLTAVATAAIAAGMADARRPSPPEVRGTVFVTERQLGSVAAFDAASGDVRWRTTVGSTPIGVVVPRGTGRAYVSEEGSDRMSVLDARTGAPLGAIPMGPMSMPHHLMASSSGRYVYVAEFGHAEVGVVDTRTDTRVAGFVTSPLDDARTHAVWITADGKNLYATVTRVDRSQIGDVAKLDAHTGERLCTIAVGADPSEILVTKGGKTGWVSVRRENKIKELDLRGDCPVLTGREAVIGTQPDTLQLTDGGRLLVVTLRGVPAQISLLDTRTLAVRLVSIAGHTTTGHHWLSEDGRVSFVAVESTGATPAEKPAGLVVVDNVSGAVLADYPYPVGTRPHGVFAVPWTLP